MPIRAWKTVGARLTLFQNPQLQLQGRPGTAGASHDIEGQVCLVVLEGEGEFLGQDNASLPAKKGDALICDIAEPHGFRAKTDVRLLVTIAPPI